MFIKFPQLLVLRERRLSFLEYDLKLSFKDNCIPNLSLGTSGWGRPPLLVLRE
ncbi:MAG: hypothetical protein WAT71_13435 [Ignavibacteria bacterium]